MIAFLGIFRIIPAWAYGALAIVALCLGIEIHGQHRGAARIQALWDKDVAAAEAQAETLRILKQSSIDKSATKYAVKQARQQVIVKTIIKEVDRYVPTTLPALPSGFRVFHDAAAAGEAIDDSALSDATPVLPGTVAKTVAANYANCRSDQERLATLQDIIRTLTGEPNGKAETVK